MNKWKLLIERCEDKGIEFYSLLPHLKIWVNDPFNTWIGEYYKNMNNKLIDDCLLEIDFMRHYDKRSSLTYSLY